MRLAIASMVGLLPIGLAANASAGVWVQNTDGGDSVTVLEERLDYTNEVNIVSNNTFNRNLPQFNPAWGTVTSIECTIIVSGASDWDYSWYIDDEESTDSGLEGITDWGFTIGAGVTAPGASFYKDDSDSGYGPLYPELPEEERYTTHENSGALFLSGGDSFNIPSPHVSAYIGLGTFPVTLKFDSQTMVSAWEDPVDSTHAEVSHTGIIEATATWNFIYEDAFGQMQSMAISDSFTNAVPEPATASTVLLLGAMAMGRRFRRRV